MTLATTANRVQYDGNGTTVSFSFPYKFNEDDHLVVVLTNDGVDAILVLDTHYTITGAGEESGGTVEMTTAPATGTTLTIYRDVDAVQQTDLTNQKAYFLTSLEDALDYEMMAIQQIQEGLGRCVKSGIVEGQTDLTAANIEDYIDAKVESGISAPLGIVNVKSPLYGATGNGVSDDAAAIQKAATAASGKALFFPDGIYILGDDITLPPKVAVIANRGLVILKSDGATARKLIIEGGSAESELPNVSISNLVLQDVFISYYDYVHKLHVKNVNVQGVNVHTSTGITGLYSGVGTGLFVHDLLIEDSEFSETTCPIQHSLADGYLGYDKIVIRHNYIHDIVNDGIQIGQAVPTYTQTYCLVENNRIKTLGQSAIATYIAGVTIDAFEAHVLNNSLEDISSTDYWEVDGIYVKAQRAVISGNLLKNAGYRSSIQVKDLAEAEDVEAESILISNNTIIFDDTDTGYDGWTYYMFNRNYWSNIYGGINIVTSNTTVENNRIRGAGVSIYSANSYIPWLINNIAIRGNDIRGNRNRYAMLFSGAGENWTVEHNTIKDSDISLNYGTMNCFGIAFIMNPTWYAEESYWIDDETLFANKMFRDITVQNNVIDINIADAVGVYALAFWAQDSYSGEDPASFDHLIVKNNLLNAVNGTGTGYGISLGDTDDRFTDCYFSGNISIDATTAKFQFNYPVTKYGNGYITGTVTPIGAVTPLEIGENYLNSTTGIWYKAIGLTNTSWLPLGSNFDPTIFYIDSTNHRIGIGTTAPTDYVVLANKPLRITDASTETNAMRISTSSTKGLIETRYGTPLVLGYNSADKVKVTATGLEPATDNTFYLGKNDDDTPFAWKGLIMKDTTNGKYYRVEITNGSIVATDLTD